MSVFDETSPFGYDAIGAVDDADELWALEWLRPDGWDEAGVGFTSERDAREAGIELPGGTLWRVVRYVPDRTEP